MYTCKGPCHTNHRTKNNTNTTDRKHLQYIITHLVKGEASEILLVEVPCEASPEAESELIQAEFQQVVDERNGQHRQPEARQVHPEGTRVILSSHAPHHGGNISCSKV